uniref:Uncharacterized protein n=1 Tax=Setaria italica TaxID=4555 RepID=K3Y0Q6_SETIT
MPSCSHFYILLESVLMHILHLHLTVSELHSPCRVQLILVTGCYMESGVSAALQVSCEDIGWL